MNWFWGHSYNRHIDSAESAVAQPWDVVSVVVVLVVAVSGESEPQTGTSWCTSIRGGDQALLSDPEHPPPSHCGMESDFVRRFSDLGQIRDLAPCFITYIPNNPYKYRRI